MKTFSNYINESLDLIRATGNRKLVMHNNQMVGHIDFIPGTPKIIPGSRDRWAAYYLGVYRDGKLRINRTTTRTIGMFTSEKSALEAIQRVITDGTV
jgi:hypothetical protein